MIAGFITKLVKTITFRRLLTYTLAAFISIVLYTLYENRSAIFVSLTTKTVTNPVGLTFTVSKDTEKALKDLVDATPEIIGMAVFSADLRLNESRPLFYYSDNNTLKASQLEIMQTGDLRLPLFSSLEENNAEVIKLINGQFSCMPFSATMLSKINPELNGVIHTVCRVSIPSYYGYFSGYVSVYFSENISTARQEQYKSTLEGLTTTVYFRDVIPTQKKIRDMIIRP